MLPIARWQQRCTGWMEPSKQALKSGILACTLLTSPAFALSVDDAKHLALRTSFAANPSLMNALLPLSREEAVDYVLNQVEPHPVEPPDFTVNPEPRPNVSKLNKEEREALRDKSRIEKEALRSWWIERLVTTQNPLEEQMVLFWANHFTSSIQKPDDAVIAWQQHEIERNQALGRFDLMLKTIMQDPAILIYLDNQRNKKNSPNENLARELLELYTLGEGNYTEQDIKEVARALTGWSVNWHKRALHLQPAQHDAGKKIILGEESNFTMPEVLDLLLERPETSELITRKLWHQFISPNPDEKRVKEIAAAFRKHNYKIKPLLRILMLDDAFWSDKNRAALVKSPLEMLVGLYRQAEAGQAPNNLTSALSAGLGQHLFAPPNVKGWPIANDDWINSETLMKRQNSIVRLMRAKESNPNMTDEEAALNEAMQKWASSEAFNYQKDWLLAAPPVGDVESDDPMETLKNLLTDPVYQLK
jgi:uncharacterized protein (DUF1800 family)